MNRTVLIALAAVVGVGVAALVIRPPDTGGAVADAPVRTPGAEDAPEAPIEQPTDGEGSRVTDENSQPARPETVALAERRTQNDAMLVGMQGSAWTMVKREVALLSHPKGKDYLTEINDLVRELRASRLTPDTQRITDLQNQQATLRDRMKADGVTSPGIDTQFSRLDELVKRYPIGEAAPADGAAPVSTPTTPSSEL